MQVTELALPGVKIIEPTYFEDYRGYYCETYSMRTLAEYGITDEFVQDNHSMTLKELCVVFIFRTIQCHR